MNKALTIGLVLGALVLFALFFSQNKEKFYSDDYFPRNINFTSDDPNVLSNGTVQKTKLQDGDYLYDYFYNLPNAFSDFQVVRPGVLFNEKLNKRTYSVFLGKTKDTLEKVGNLTRRGDGYHVFTLKTKEDYKVSVIKLDDKVIHYLNL